MRISASSCFVSLGLIACPSLCGAIEGYPLAEVRPGLIGEGRTIFEGSRVESFEARVLGVLENALGPRRSIILARLSGGPLATTGVLQGMSGSPVYVDGRLLGAVAYSFAFAKEPIAGITPWQDMLDSGASTGPTPVSRWAGALNARTALRLPFSAAELRSLLQVSPPATARPAEREPETALRALAAPLVLTGFDLGSAEWARATLAPLGLAAVAAAGGASDAPIVDEPQVQPGSALAISLVQGDLDISATGTATALVGDRVYAFGHAFQNMGPIRLPLRRARVLASVPSVQQSWKAAVALDTVGTFDQDRSAGVTGQLGPGPRMVPVEVTLRSSSGQSRDLHLELAEDEALTPLLAYASLYSVLQAFERARGASTVTVVGEIELSNGKTVHMEDIYADEQPALKAAGLVAAPMVLLLSNGFESVSVRKVVVRATFAEAREAGSLLRVFVEPAGPLRPGGRATVRAVVRTHRGERRSVSLPLEVPSGLVPGRYSLLLGSAESMTAEDQRTFRDGLAPQNLAQLVRRLNELRHDNRLYARLVRSAPGTVAGGERLPSLPSSMVAVLSAADQGSPVVPLQSAVVWEAEAPLALALDGARSLTLSVEN